MPRCYTPEEVDSPSVTGEVLIFCDASERAYGAVAYFRTENNQNKTYLAFLMARSRVAPKRLLSMPRLELSAAVVGAQIATVI